MTRYPLALLALVLVACTSPVVELYPDHDAAEPVDLGTDAARDVGTDATLDAGADLGTDANVEPDTGTPCECSTGLCCDGCHVRPSTYLCIDDGPVKATCSTRTYPGPSCGGSDRITLYLGDRYCDGIRPECRGRIVQGTSSVNDRCTYDPYQWDWITCRPDGSDLGASCARWCG